MLYISGATAVSFLFVVMMFRIRIAEIHEEVFRDFSVQFVIFLLQKKQRVPRIFKKVSTCMRFLVAIVIVRYTWYLFMDELHQAVAPFLGAPGGGMGGSSGPMGGGSGGSGWSSFDLGVVAEDNEEEVGLPKPQPAFNYALPEPNQDSVRTVLRNRLIIQRSSTQNFVVHNEEVERLISLKKAIADRMGELDQSPFWNRHKNRIVRDFIQTPKGEEYIIPSLEGKLQSLFGESPRGTFYDQLLKMKKSFYQEAPFRGPRGD